MTEEKKYLHLQSIVNYRILIKEDGSLGSPEIIAKWTKEQGAPKKKTTKKKAKVVVEEARMETGEIVF